MDPAHTLRTARRRSGLSQAELADRAGTSQAAVSAYESGRKQPSVTTLSRLLGAAGWRLSAEPARNVVRQPSAAELRDVDRRFGEVLELAAAFPVRHHPDTGFPRLAEAPHHDAG